MKREENFEAAEEEDAEALENPIEKKLKGWDVSKEPSARRSSVLRNMPKSWSPRKKCLTAARVLQKFASGNAQDPAVKGKAKADAEYFFKETKKR